MVKSKYTAHKKKLKEPIEKRAYHKGYMDALEFAREQMREETVQKPKKWKY